MRLLVDSDAFCKLGATDLFESGVALLEGDPARVERLTALPHMLRRSRALRAKLGQPLADALAARADLLPSAPVADPRLVDELVGVDEIDPGEVQLLALAADETLLLVSGDKRALRAVCQLDSLVPMLNGKLVCLEALLLALCVRHGAAQVCAAASNHRNLDGIFAVCLRDAATAIECLQSYLRGLKCEVEPLVLWSPPGVDP